MTINKTSPETETKTWRHLALAIANALSVPTCPPELVAALLEIVDPLTELLLAPATAIPHASSVLLLRALANGIGRPKPTVEKAPISQIRAKNGALSQRRQVDMPREIKNDSSG